MFSCTFLTPASCGYVLLLPLYCQPSHSVFVSASLVSTAFQEEMSIAHVLEEEGEGGGEGSGIKHLTQGKGTKCYSFRELVPPAPYTFTCN